MDLVDEDAALYPQRFYRWVLYDAAGETGAITPLPGGRFVLTFNGLAGRTYVLQASSDLKMWTNVPNIDPEFAYSSRNDQGIEVNMSPNPRSIGFNLRIVP